MRFKNYLLFLFLSLLISCNQKRDLKTLFEKTKGKETDNYDSTILYCKMLEKESDMVKYVSFGKSAQGRDLPMLIVSKSKEFDIKSIKKSQRVILMIQACIHPGEPDGKDAGLLLIRNLISKPELKPLIDKVVIVFLPILNPDGFENQSELHRFFQNGPRSNGIRTSAQNLNLNRDFSKADSPEIQSWLKMYHQWNPDFFIDCHVADGTNNQYTITYNLGIFGNMTSTVTAWAKNVYLKYIEDEMKNSGNPISYYAEFKKSNDIKSGMISGIWGPMYSDEYVSVLNRPAFLIETQMYKDYFTRVMSTYEILKKTLVLLNKEAENLKDLLNKNDEFLASSNFRSQPYNLVFDLSKDSLMIDFLGYKYDVVKSEISGGEWIKFDNKVPVSYKIPWFNKPIPVAQCKIPEAYIIPVEWAEIINKLNLHGIEMKKIKAETSIKLQMSKLSNIKYESYPYEGHLRLQDFKIQEYTIERKFLKGSVVIETSQSKVPLIAHLLEPKGPVSFLSWGFFNTCFQLKEKPENYIIEQIARNMIEKNPNLLNELNEWKNQNPEIEKSPSAILEWFFNKSDYADKTLNEYPVGKIYKSEELQKLLVICE